MAVEDLVDRAVPEAGLVAPVVVRAERVVRVLADPAVAVRPLRLLSPFPLFAACC
jgi:hypothetical protein